MNPPTENIAGYTVGTQSVSACIADVVAWIQQAPPATPCRWLACLNPHSYAVALDDPQFSQALHAADWLIPDGAGIVLASKLLGGQIRQRVTGSDIFREVHVGLSQAGGYRVFFLGSTETTLATIRQRMARDYPNLQIAGTYSPPFKTEFSTDDHQAMIAAINAAAPDVLWVGMTAPKQEKWLHQHQAQLNVKFAAAVGAVFDFYSGRVKRSHPVFQRLGLEWLPRLLQQPRRLWRRMGVSAPIFIWHVLRQRVKGKG
ncbi:MAG: WecB/TagA/CpsF family glycosyltransferase [Candidatus Contendobacter sp.]|nr:WecB/TagA/CpsF family glycosyltransferase [Candidatus Contendobacter sp.]